MNTPATLGAEPICSTPADNAVWAVPALGHAYRIVEAAFYGRRPHGETEGHRIFKALLDALEVADIEISKESGGHCDHGDRARVHYTLIRIRNALRFYADPKSYRYATGKGVGRILFDQGRTAAVALEELEELLGDGGTTFIDPLIQDFDKMLDEERAKRSATTIGMDPDYLATVTYEDIVACEQRALEAEKVAVRLRRLVRQPDEPGSYVGDTYYPVGGTQASHRWNGKEWEWFPELCVREVENA